MGFNCVQPLPVHEFAMDRSWGYNPASFFAPESSYGSPVRAEALRRRGAPARPRRDLRRRLQPRRPGDNVAVGVRRLHARGRHLLRGRPATPTGVAGPAWWKREVQDFFYQNARMYLEEYHADGLRFDVTTQINGNHLRLVVGPAAGRVPRQVPHRRAPAGRSVDRQRRAASAPPGTPTPTTRCQRALAGQDPLNKVKGVLGLGRLRPRLEPGEVHARLARRHRRPAATATPRTG